MNHESTNRVGSVRDGVSREALLVAVVGCGRFGRNWLRVLDASDEVATVYAVDPDPHALDWVKEHYPAAIRAGSIAEISGVVNAAVIAAPSHVHGAISSELISHGAHLLVEKPFANNASEARRLIEQSVRRDTTLMVGHQLLVHPYYDKLVGFAKRGRIGRPLRIESVRCGPLIPGADRDVFDAFAPHDLAMICAFAGEYPLTVTARVESDLNETIESATIGLVFPSGLRATVTVGVRSERERRFEVYGSSGTICFEDDHLRPTLVMNSPTGDFHATGPLSAREEPLWLEAQQFFECIHGRDLPRAGAELALIVTQILDGVRCKQRGGRGREDCESASAISF